MSSDPATHRLALIRQRIEVAAAKAGRDPKSVNLIAVSKTMPVEKIRPILAAGHRLFGENRVQEAAAKWPELRGEFPEIDLHLIGPLQTNKAAAAVQLFDSIETLDREKLARVSSRMSPLICRSCGFAATSASVSP